MLFRRNKCLVGLDIGSSAVKAIELKRSRSGYSVAAIGVEPVPHDSIVDGAVIDFVAVTAAVRRVLDNKRFTSREVAAALSGNSVIVKSISLPHLKEPALSDSIYWGAEEYIPFDVHDVNLDYEVSDCEDGQAGLRVLLVAAKKDKLADYTTVIAQAGRFPAVVDVDAFALQNAYETNYGLDAGRVVVLLNAGASVINVNIVAGQQSVFTRDISIGGNTFTDAIQKELNVPFETAERLKKRQHLDTTLGAEVVPVLRAMTDTALLEVEKTFDFFKAAANVDHIDRIVLSGGASLIDGFADALHKRFGTTVERFNPFRRVTFDSTRLGVSADEVRPVAAVALGLALRRAWDR